MLSLRSNEINKQIMLNLSANEINKKIMLNLSTNKINKKLLGLFEFQYRCCFQKKNWKYQIFARANRNMSGLNETHTNYSVIPRFGRNAVSKKNNSVKNLIQEYLFWNSIFANFFCNFFNVSEALIFLILQKYGVKFKFLFSQNNRYDSNFNQIFDCKFRMQGLIIKGSGDQLFIAPYPILRHCMLL